jgi:hypothetical protein
MGLLDTSHDYEAFAATVMEDTPGFHQLAENERDLLLYESIHYLQSFIDYIDSIVEGSQVDVFPPTHPHRRVMLLVG